MHEDARAFLASVTADRRALFAGAGPVYITRAPGRLDVMGGIADYSGSHVLQATIEEAVCCALQIRTDGRLVLVSELPDTSELRASLRVGELESAAERSYRAANEYVSRDPAAAWSAYVAGAWAVLRAEGVANGPLPGATVFLRSAVPMAVGVASSAAVAVASMSALVGALGLCIAPLELARLCQIVENCVVGAPCGIMDQVAVTLGKRNGPVIILCQPSTVLGNLHLPDGVQVCGIDSAVEKYTAGDRYRRVRVATFMGRKILSDRHGKPAAGGYLANLTREDYLTARAGLPPRMLGSEFLEVHGETGDPVTEVDPDQVYPVRGCTEHAIYENNRTVRFIELLRGAGERDGTAATNALRRAGRLMYASHWSYTYRCGLGHPDVSMIVKLVRDAGPSQGVYGAKITGGGTGGTVAVLATSDGIGTVNRIAREYAVRTGRRSIVFTGSSPGAAAFGVVEATLQPVAPSAGTLPLASASKRTVAHSGPTGGE